jgi:hypothetical protein
MYFQLVPLCTSDGKFIDISVLRGAEVKDFRPLGYDTLNFAGSYLYFVGTCYLSHQATLKRDLSNFSEML